MNVPRDHSYLEVEDKRSHPRTGCSEEECHIHRMVAEDSLQEEVLTARFDRAEDGRSLEAWNRAQSHTRLEARIEQEERRLLVGDQRRSAVVAAVAAEAREKQEQG